MVLMASESHCWLELQEEDQYWLPSMSIQIMFLVRAPALLSWLMRVVMEDEALSLVLGKM